MFGMVATYGVVPDIITSAKGLASGLPIGITITRSELADIFKGPHINTFGGNPLSSRAAKVTLDVIEKRQLIANAKRQGETLLAELRAMQQRYPLMGDVRGHGLMIGVELVKDPQSKEYAPAEATRFLEEMRKRGVLVGKGGRFGNVIRIQPPLIFSDDDTREFLKTFEASIATLT
jgi:4-aminobutyrate aminotransferase-like enzyme